LCLAPDELSQPTGDPSWAAPAALHDWTRPQLNAASASSGTRRSTVSAPALPDIPQQDMPKPSRRIDTRYLAIGIAVGVALGVALDNPGPWIAVGVALGLAVGRVRRRPD
jgi:hypothetical protein